MGIFGGNDKPAPKAKATPTVIKRADVKRSPAAKKASETNRMRDTRDEDTPDAKATAAAKKEAADRQFAKADAKNEPTKQASDDNPNIAAAKKAAADNDKAVAQVEKDRRAAKVEAMKPATDEQIADVTARRAVTGF